MLYYTQYRIPHGADPCRARLKRKPILMAETCDRKYAVCVDGVFYIPGVPADEGDLICSRVSGGRVSVDVYHAVLGDLALWLSAGRDPHGYGASPIHPWHEHAESPIERARALMADLLAKHGDRRGAIMLSGQPGAYSALEEAIGAERLARHIDNWVAQRCEHLTAFYAAVEDEVDAKAYRCGRAPGEIVPPGYLIESRYGTVPLSFVADALECADDLMLFTAIANAEGIAPVDTVPLTTLDEIARRESEPGFIGGVVLAALDHGYVPLTVKFVGKPER